MLTQQDDDSAATLTTREISVLDKLPNILLHTLHGPRAPPPIPKLKVSAPYAHECCILRLQQSGIRPHAERMWCKQVLTFMVSGLASTATTCPLKRMAAVSRRVASPTFAPASSTVTGRASGMYSVSFLKNVKSPPQNTCIAMHCAVCFYLEHFYRKQRQV